MMQTVLFNLNSHTLFTLVYAAPNAVLMFLIAMKVYHRDPVSIINLLFSWGATLAGVALVMYPLGGIFWYISIFGIQVITITSRLVLFFTFASQVLICWCALILYEGEGLWNRRRNLLFLVLSMVVISLVLLTPDATYVIQGPPSSETIDTGENMFVTSIFYPGTAMLLFVSMIVFSKTYTEFKDDDPIIAKQSLYLAIGVGLNSLAVIICFMTLLLLAYFLTSLWFLFSTLGIILMSLGFSQDASILKLKVISQLRRMTVLLSKGRIKLANAQLDFLSQLVEREESTVATIRMRILEGIIRIFQARLNDAKAALEEAKTLAKRKEHTHLQEEVNTHLEHLKVHLTAETIYDTIDMSQEYISSDERLREALDYIDTLISTRQALETGR